MSITLELDAKHEQRLELVCKTLELDSTGALSEALDIFFRKLVTEGKIPIEESMSGISDPSSEKDYKLEDIPDIKNDKKYGLTAKERESLGKTAKKNLSKAEQGDPAAQNVMGTYYESGNGLEKNYDKAIYWYTKAAEQGNTNAQYHLGVLYNKAKENPLRAYFWFEVARMCGFNITHIHQDYIIRLTEMLSPRQIKSAQDEAVKKVKAIQGGK
ncbi:MAG: sel1 repeat family protein [Synergistaceae bacterium]|nr:sel1 repeat family protein [Synergistaceae bacterium]